MGSARFKTNDAATRAGGAWRRITGAPPVVWLGLAAIAVLAVSLVASIGRPAGETPALARRDASIAVLPFEDLSTTGDRDYFAIGVSDQIRERLAQIDGIRVIARASSMAVAVQNKGARRTAEELSVGYLLEGTVRWDADRAHVTSHLVRADDESQVWSRSYNREMTAVDMFAIQNDIAGEVAGALSISLDVDARGRLQGAGTHSLEAYDMYLRASALVDASMGASDSSAQLDLLRSAIAIDPDYAAAWSLMGIQTGGLQWYARSPEEAHAYRDEALELTRHAIELDPGLADAHAVYAGMLVTTKDYAASHRQHEVALSLARNKLSLEQFVRLLQRTGRIQAALAPAAEASSFDPLSPAAPFFRYELMRQARRYDEARAALERHANGDYSDFGSAMSRWLVEANASPSSPLARDHLAHAVSVASPDVVRVLAPTLDNVEAPETALAALRRELADTAWQYPDKRLHIAQLAAWLGDPELALEAMTIELEWSTVRATFLWDELFSEMRQLAAFKTFAADNGFVAYWREYGWADACRPLGEDDFECF